MVTMTFGAGSDAIVGSGIHVPVMVADMPAEAEAVPGAVAVPPTPTLPSEMLPAASAGGVQLAVFFGVPFADPVPVT
jgi:hypothetical protein